MESLAPAINRFRRVAGPFRSRFWPEAVILATPSFKWAREVGLLCPGGLGQLDTGRYY